MIKQIVCAVLLLLCAVAVFGQKTDKELKRQVEAWQRQDVEKQANEIEKKFDSRHETLKFLLPKDANGWVVQIVTTGGFTGKGLPTLTLTSTGSFYSGQDADFYSPAGEIELTEFETVEAPTLEKISQIINPLVAENFKSEPASLKESEKIDVCSDCYKTQIYIARRDAKGDVKIYVSESKNALFSSENFKIIHRTIMQLAGYQS